MSHRRTVDDLPVIDTAPRPNTRPVWERPSAREIADSMAEQAVALARDAAAAVKLAEQIDACSVLLAGYEDETFVGLLQEEMARCLTDFTRLTGQKVVR